MTIRVLRAVFLAAIVFILPALLGCLAPPSVVAQGEYGLTVTMHQHMVPAGHTALIDYSTGQTDRPYDLVLISSAGSTPVADCGQSSAARTCHYTHTVGAPGATVYYKAVLEQNGSPVAQSLVDAVTWGTLHLIARGGSKRRLTQGDTLLASMTPARLEAHHSIAIYEISGAGGTQTRRQLKGCTANVDYGRSGTATTCLVHIRSPQHAGLHRYQALVIGPVSEYPDGIAITSNQQAIQWGTTPPATAPPTPPAKPKPVSVTFDNLVVQTAAGVVRSTFRVNQPLSIVARYTVHNLHQSYIKGTIRRVFQTPVKGRFQTAAVSSDTIVAVKGTNPPNQHSFTPQVTGPIRIVVSITLGTVVRQRTVDIRITH